jgi:hypothetical protein
MGRTALYDKSAVEKLTSRQNGLITRSQALACELTEQALRMRLRPEGPWQVLAPGLYATNTGKITEEQRTLAALLYAGQGSVITGQAAMAAHGINTLDRTVIDVLIPIERRRQDCVFVHILRTSRMPSSVFKAGEVLYAPVARSVADAARQSNRLTEVRSIIASAVQWRRVSVAGLAAELNQGPTAGSGPFRAALAEIADGIRSAAEGDLRKLIKRSGLSDPLYNPRLYAGEEFIAIPDAWWPEASLAVEVDSRQWHLSPADWERTMTRHSRMSALGITVLHYPPSRLHAEPRAVVAEIRSALEIGHGRPRLPIRTEPTK